MFEGIYHNCSSDGITSASYRAGEVIGSISFQAGDDRSCVLSTIGPDAAVRECSISHYYGSFTGRHRARSGELVVDRS